MREANTRYERVRSVMSAKEKKQVGLNSIPPPQTGQIICHQHNYNETSGVSFQYLKKQNERALAGAGGGAGGTGGGGVRKPSSKKKSDYDVQIVVSNTEDVAEEYQG